MFAPKKVSATWRPRNGIRLDVGREGRLQDSLRQRGDEEEGMNLSAAQREDGLGCC